MIIKRRVSKQFVQIDNEIVRDQRLSLDEHGMLHYLLSLPDEWEVKAGHIEHYWKIGRERRARIFNALERVGWLKKEFMRNDQGDLIGSRWIISDEPGPEKPDAAIDGDSDDDDSRATTGTTAAPESKGPAVLVSGDRGAASPTTGPPEARATRGSENPSPLRINTGEEERDSKNTYTTAGAREDDDTTAVPPPFGQLLKLWPAENVASAFACQKVFSRMTAWQQRLAHDGVRPYLADCRSRGQNRLCDLRTYLDERRWEKFTAPRGTAGKPLYVLQRGTPQALRWRTHFERVDPRKLVMFDEQMRCGRGYTVPSEWPPPTPIMTQDDHDAVANL